MKINYLLTILFSVILTGQVFATHVLGGELQVKRLNDQALRYAFTLRLYYDPSSPLTDDALSICPGDGSQRTLLRQSVVSYPFFKVAVFSVEHNYASAGAYTAAVNISNRSVIVNAPAAVNASMVVETYFTTSQASNATPVFEAFLQNVVAVANQPFTLNCAATDAEGDSLSYRLQRPWAGVDCRKAPLSQYVFPNEVSQKGTFALSPRTGQLNWNAPTNVGRYAFALVVEEWRQGVKISQTHREFFVDVVDKPGTVIGALPDFRPVELITGGISDANNNPIEVRLSPVPTNRTVGVSVVSPEPSALTLTIFDTSGRELLRSEWSGITTQHQGVLDVESIGSGIYLLVVQSKSGQATVRFVKW